MALIPCAGKSSRMGRCKALLEIAGSPIIERIINFYKDAGITHIKIVLSSKHIDLINLLEGYRIAYVFNNDYESDMFCSIKVGLSHRDRDFDAFFLHPCDVPFVNQPTLRGLVETIKTQNASIAIPTYKKQPGHPILIAASMIDHLFAYAGTEGMRGFIRNLSDGVSMHEFDDPGILINLNTEEDYRKYAPKGL